MQLRIRLVPPSNKEEIDEYMKKFPSAWPVPRYDNMPEGPFIAVQRGHAMYIGVLEWAHGDDENTPSWFPVEFVE